MKKLLVVTGLAAVIGLTTLAYAQAIPKVTIVAVTDYFQDLQGGNAQAASTYASAGQIAAFVLSADYGNPPVLTACGTGTPSVNGNDFFGTLTMGTSATGCVVTFAVARNSPPNCLVTWLATPLASQSFSVSALALTLVQTSTSGNKASYACAYAAGR